MVDFFLTFDGILSSDGDPFIFNLRVPLAYIPMLKNSEKNMGRIKICHNKDGGIFPCRCKDNEITTLAPMDASSFSTSSYPLPV